MKSQAALPLGDDPYEPYEASMADDYPRDTFKPLFPGFHKKGKVSSGLKNKRIYLVDLSIGECTCQRGAAWKWTDNTTVRNPDGKYFAQSYCTHKLRMMASIAKDWPVKATKPAADQAYIKALATRYNPFETVSAFHKELRRGDFEAAWFWGLILGAKRGSHGIIKYLLNIIYEETRDHDLAEYLVGLVRKPRDEITLSDLSRSIAWFCKSKKKWELPHRLVIFKDEMRGYDMLAKAYSPDVAKGAGIIPSDQEALLKGYMDTGFKTSNWATFQRGWKGLQKMVFADKHGSLEDYRYYLYEYLYDFADKRLPDTHPVWGVVSYVNERIEAQHGAGYHELNAIADAIAGEPYEAGLLPDEQRKRLLARPTPAIPYIYWPPIPLYAHDNHTYGGKALMRRFGHELKPGAEQVNLDFRWCGAYFGVCYRMVCQEQFGTVDSVKWGDVKWPRDLYRVVDMLWY